MLILFLTYPFLVISSWESLVVSVVAMVLFALLGFGVGKTPESLLIRIPWFVLLAYMSLALPCLLLMSSTPTQDSELIKLPMYFLSLYDIGFWAGFLARRWGMT